MNVKIFQMNDSDIVASTLTKEETISWYEKDTGEQVDSEEVIELDPNALMFDEVKNTGQKIINKSEAIEGSFIRCNDGICECVSYLEAYKRANSPKEPFIIASTEY